MATALWNSVEILSKQIEHWPLWPEAKEVGDSDLFLLRVVSMAVKRLTWLSRGLQLFQDDGVSDDRNATRR